MILDEVMPRYDVTMDESLVVDAAPGVAFAAVRDLDLLTVRTPLLTASMFVRGLPDRLHGRQPQVPPRLTFGGDEGEGLPGWVRLGERPGEELCLGAVGRFWTPTIEWRPVTAQEFPGFAEPGWGRIGVSLSARPYAQARSLLTYECRTGTFDEASRQAFARYWWLIRPFVGHIMRATLRTAKAHAEGAG